MPSRDGVAASEPNWECPKCGHRMYAEFTGTFDFSVLVGCPGCGTAMDRLDPLGMIEVELRGDSEPVSDVLEATEERYMREPTAASGDRRGTDAERELCACGHQKASHDYFGCLFASCRDTCKRRWGSTEGKTNG